MFQDYNFQIGIAVFFITLIASRYIILGAVKKLSDEDKAKLLSSKIINQSQTRMLIVFAMLGGYYIAITQYPQYANELLIGFLLILIISRVFSFITTQQKLRQLQLPDFYTKAFITSSVIYNAGILIFFFLLVKDFL